jgi:hypothetical protein
MISDFFYIAAGNRNDMRAILALDENLSVPSILTIPLFIGAAVVFLVWFYGAARNVVAVHGPDYDISPGWAVGWWFIPFANLVIPCKYMMRINRMSAPRQSEKERDGGDNLILAWWLLFVASNAATYYVAKYFFRADTPAKVATAAGLDIAALGLDLFAIFLAVLVVRRVTAAQQNNLAPIADPGTA